MARHAPVDEEYARTTPFGTRVAHGLLGLSLADGLKTRSDFRFVPGMSLGWTWDFKLPIKLGDTVHVKFPVGSMRLPKRPGWGIVVLPSELMLADRQTQARGMVVEQDHPVLGRIRLPNLPFRFSECDTSPRSPAPLLGQHNREIAAALGYAPDVVDAMLRDGVLYAEPAACE
jgi:hypothetical protein